MKRKETFWKRMLKNKMEWVLLIVLILAVIPIILGFIERSQSNTSIAGQQVKMSMSGFSPATIILKAGQPLSIELVNEDNSMHSDGGGWHQFASDELNFNYKVSPESKKIIVLSVDKVGEFTFYCDICCGGKENPSMQGKIIVNRG